MQTTRAQFQTHLFSFDPVEIALHKNLIPCVIFGCGEPVFIESDDCKVHADIVCIKPGILHRVKVPDSGAEIMFFDGVTLNCARRSISRVDRSWQHIPAAFDAGDTDLINQFRRTIGGTNALPDPQVMKIVDDLYSNPFNRMSQDELAIRLGLERTQALRHFKSVTGQTFRKFKIWAASVATARDAHEGQAIGLAGLDAGFSDAAHTARTAMAIFGMTPTLGLSCLKTVSTLG